MAPHPVPTVFNSALELGSHWDPPPRTTNTASPLCYRTGPTAGTASSSDSPVVVEFLVGCSWGRAYTLLLGAGNLPHRSPLSCLHPPRAYLPGVVPVGQGWGWGARDAPDCSLPDLVDFLE